jgi:hypothetical protein
MNTMKCPKCKKKCLKIIYYSDKFVLKYPNLIGLAVHSYNEQNIFHIVKEKCDFDIDYRK